MLVRGWRNHGSRIGAIRRKRFVSLAVAIVGLAVAGLAAAAMLASADDRIALVGGVSLVIIAAVPGSLRLRADPLDAVGVYVLVSMVFLGLMSLAWLGRPPIPAPGLERADVVVVMGLIAACLLAFTLGARLMGRARRMPPLALPRDRAPSRWAMILVFSLSIGSMAFGLAVGAFGYGSDAETTSPLVLAISQLVQQAAAVGGIVILVCAYAGFLTDDRGLKRLIWVLLPIQAAAGFLLGFKSESILPVIYVALAYIAAKGRIPWKPLIAAAAVTILVLVPANVVFRDVVRPLPGAPALTPKRVAERTYEYVQIRFRLVDDVAIIKRETPTTYPYGDGQRYSLLPALIFVPRAIWRDKPLLDFGQEFSHTYWRIPDLFRTSTPPTQVGDLYRNFRAGGAILGLGVWGLFVGAWTAMRRRWRSPWIDAVYLWSLVGWVWKVELDLPMLIVTAAKTIPLTVATAWLLLPGRSGQPGYRRLISYLRFGDLSGQSTAFAASDHLVSSKGAA